jgi:hypothetical protein
MRWHTEDLDAIDGFARSLEIDRTEGIRRLVRAGLAAMSAEVQTLPYAAREHGASEDVDAFRRAVRTVATAPVKKAKKAKKAAKKPKR